MTNARCAHDSTSFLSQLEAAALDKMMAVIVLLVPLLLPLVSAQTFRWGPCPTPMVQPNFELSKVGLYKYKESNGSPPKMIIVYSP